MARQTSLTRSLLPPALPPSAALEPEHDEGEVAEDDAEDEGEPTVEAATEAAAPPPLEERAAAAPSGPPPPLEEQEPATAAEGDSEGEDTFEDAEEGTSALQSPVA